MLKTQNVRFFNKKACINGAFVEIRSKAIWEIPWIKNNRFLSYSLVREERNGYDMHFMDIRLARNWLDGYNNEDDVADSKSREIEINSYRS